MSGRFEEGVFSILRIECRRHDIIAHVPRAAFRASSYRRATPPSTVPPSSSTPKESRAPQARVRVPLPTLLPTRNLGPSRIRVGASLEALLLLAVPPVHGARRREVLTPLLAAGLERAAAAGGGEPGAEARGPRARARVPWRVHPMERPPATTTSAPRPAGASLRATNARGTATPARWREGRRETRSGNARRRGRVRGREEGPRGGWIRFSSEKSADGRARGGFGRRFRRVAFSPEETRASEERATRRGRATRRARGGASRRARAVRARERSAPLASRRVRATRREIRVIRRAARTRERGLHGHLGRRLGGEERGPGRGTLADGRGATRARDGNTAAGARHREAGHGHGERGGHRASPARSEVRDVDVRERPKPCAGSGAGAGWDERAACAARKTRLWFSDCLPVRRG